MNRGVRDAFEGFLDLIYPPKCLSCGTIGQAYLCRSCVAQIESVPRPYCRRCGHPIEKSRCRDCWGLVSSFATARAAGIYSGTLRQAIHAFKYGGHRMLAEPLAKLLHRYLTEDADFPWESADVVVPVPIHPTKRRQRGYNQSELLAEELCRLTGKPLLSDALIRQMRTRSQVELSGQQRRENMRNAFKVTKPEETRGRIVLLVDDVTTTCSTAHECSLALLRGNAAKVYVICLALDL